MNYLSPYFKNSSTTFIFICFSQIFLFATSAVQQMMMMCHYPQQQYKMIEMMGWLLMLMIPPLGILWVILNVKKRMSNKGRRRWAFFHPFCNDGGGGEKVLWCMIKELTTKTNDQIAIYSLEADKDAMVDRVKQRFGIVVNKDKFINVHIPGRALLTAKGFLTMIMHILLPMLYALKCLWKFQPDIFYDTTGYASTLVLVKLLLPSTKTAAYVHYPFISQEMIQKVREKRVHFNNSQAISRSPLLSKGKLFYYILVMKMYKFIGYFVDFAQANSSWTFNHMTSLWPHLQKTGKLTKLYPPCTVKPLLDIKKPSAEKDIVMMSLAQFRPQKQQHLQLQVLSELLKHDLKRKVTLRICGTTRGSEDEQILSNLKKIANDLKVQQNVEFIVNQPYSNIIECFKQSWIGIHTMEAEHFGISVVQMLAAGLVVVAHNSAGPKMDIIQDEKYLAQAKEDYIQKILTIVQSSSEDLTKSSQENRKKALKYSEQQFQRQFLSQVKGSDKEQ